MANSQIKIFTEIRAIFLFDPKFQRAWYSDLFLIFFGSSPVATEWDKIVAEIIHKTFVFLEHPTPRGWQRVIIKIEKW